MRVAKRVKLTIGKATKNGLPTRDNLVVQQVTPANIYPRWNQHQESSAHALFYFPEIKHIWYASSLLIITDRWNLGKSFLFVVNTFPKKIKTIQREAIPWTILLQLLMLFGLTEMIWFFKMKNLMLKLLSSNQTFFYQKYCPFQTFPLVTLATYWSRFLLYFHWCLLGWVFVPNGYQLYILV